MDNYSKRFDRIEQLLVELTLVRKDVFNFSEGCAYVDVSESHMYKLTSTGQIPCYKPNGKRIYFKRVELDEWLLRNRNTTKQEIESEAANYLIRKGRVAL